MLSTQKFDTEFTANSRHCQKSIRCCFNLGFQPVESRPYQTRVQKG